MPDGLESRGRLQGAPPCLAGLRKVGKGHEAAWELCRVSGDNPMHVTLCLDRNPDEPCCKLLFRTNDGDGGSKIGFMLLACEEHSSSLRGMWISESLRGCGLSKELLAVWLHLCRLAGLQPTTRTINKPLLSLSLSRFGFAPRSKERCLVVHLGEARSAKQTPAGTGLSGRSMIVPRDQDCRRSDSSGVSLALQAGGRTAYVRTAFQIDDLGVPEAAAALDREVTAVLGERLTLLSSAVDVRKALTLRGGAALQRCCW
jgi:hypothetical protein